MDKRVTYTEAELVAALKQGNQKALGYLYDHYSAALMGVIHQIIRDTEESEDVLQKTFIKIWENFAAYDAQKGRLYTWMLNIARNLAIDSTRSKHYKNKSRIHSGAAYVNEQDRKAADYQHESDYIGLDTILTGLKEEHRQVIDLAYFEGYTQEEISKQLNLPLGTVKTKIRQAITKLRELTQKEKLT